MCITSRTVFKYFGISIRKQFRYTFLAIFPYSIWYCIIRSTVIVPLLFTYLFNIFNKFIIHYSKSIIFNFNQNHITAMINLDFKNLNHIISTQKEKYVHIPVHISITCRRIIKFIHLCIIGFYGCIYKNPIVR